MAKAKATKRIVNSWNFREGRFMKCVATWLYDRGLRGRALLAEFRRLIPHWKEYFERPISDDAVVQRADKARRYPSENPQSNPRLKPYWRVAGEAVRRGNRLRKANIRRIVQMCEPKPEPNRRTQSSRRSRS